METTWYTKTAEHLRSLRKKKGLSYQKLHDEIKEKCGVDISADSLSNYEVEATQNHTRANKCKGMNIEFLRAFSQYYGVSTDFLLGLSDVSSTDPSMKSAMEYTGLSQSAIELIKNLQQGDNASVYNDILDYLLAYPDFTLLLIRKLHYYLMCTEAYKAAKVKRDEDIGKLAELSHGDIVKEIQLRESGEIEITLSENDIEEYQMHKDIAELRVSRQFKSIMDRIEKQFADRRLCAHYGWEEDF